jgi:hypothetical protein
VFLFFGCRYAKGKKTYANTGFLQNLYDRRKENKTIENNWKGDATIIDLEI